MSKTVAIIQARVGSSRLPGKVLADLDGIPMLAFQIKRLHLCSELSEIVVATTLLSEDDAIVELCESASVPVFRGSDTDVLARINAAASNQSAEIVVRLTADCPLIDPEIVDLVVSTLKSSDDGQSPCDYASNVLRRTYARGQDVEAFYHDVLARCDRMATSQLAREHVTVYIRSDRPDLFEVRSVEDPSGANYSDLRVTVDTAEDLEVVRKIAHDLGRNARYANITEYLRGRPEIDAKDNEHRTWTPPTVNVR